MAGSLPASSVLAGALDQASEAVAIVSVPAGSAGAARIEYVNAAFATLVRRPAARLLGSNPAELAAVVEETGAVERALSVARQEQTWQGELTIRPADGAPAEPLAVRLVPFQTGDSPAYWLCLARSLRERRQIEERLWQAQRLDAIGQLASGVAHDFNNILLALSGYSQLLLEDTPRDDPRFDDARALERAARRAATLIEHLLEFTGHHAVQAELISVSQVMGRMQPLLERILGEHIRLITDLDPDVGLVRADRGQLQQVLINLVANARDAMLEGGTLSILTQRGGPGSLSSASAHVVLSVSDTGTGMTPEVKARLFEPFFTTKGRGPGSGLGLATVKRIVEQAGGYVWVQTAPGRGTSVRVALPWAGDPEPAPRKPAAASTRARAGSETILLVEDDPAVLALAQRVLQEYGYHVLAAGGAAEATAIAAERGAEIRLLVTDVVMPGQSGPLLADELRTELPHLKILFMSGYNDAALGAPLGRRTARVLAKPFSPNDLASAVRTALDEPAPSA